jgi:hypothetical protein
MEQKLSPKCAAKTHRGIARTTRVLSVPVLELRSAYRQVSAVRGRMGGSSPA